MKKQDLTAEIARPAQTGLRSVWQWRPLASMTPAMVADVPLPSQTWPCDGTFRLKELEHGH